MRKRIEYDVDVSGFELKQGCFVDIISIFEYGDGLGLY